MKGIESSEEVNFPQKGLPQPLHKPSSWPASGQMGNMPCTTHSNRKPMPTFPFLTMCAGNSSTTEAAHTEKATSHSFKTDCKDRFAVTLKTTGPNSNDLTQLPLLKTRDVAIKVCLGIYERTHYMKKVKLALLAKVKLKPRGDSASQSSQKRLVKAPTSVLHEEVLLSDVSGGDGEILGE